MTRSDAGRTTSNQLSAPLAQPGKRPPLFNTFLSRLVWGLGVLVLLTLAAPQLWYPFGFDQAVYAACGDVIRQGGVMPRDCFETKQVGVMAMYAIPLWLSASLSILPSALPASHAVAVHAFTLAWTALTAVIIGWIGKALFGKTAGVLAGVLYWLIYAGINYWSMDQAETFANLFLVLAFYKLWQAARDAVARDAVARDAVARDPFTQGLAASPQHPRHVFNTALVAGICIGCAFWFKNIFGLIGVVLGACMLGWMWVRAIHSGQRPITPATWAVLGRFSLGYTLGTLIPIGLGVGYYAVHPGGLEALAQQWRFLQDNFPLTPPLPPEGVARMLVRFLDNGADLTADFKPTVPQLIILGGGFPFIAGLGGVGLVRGFKGHRAVVLTLLAYLVCATFLLAWQGNYIQYHYTILVPPLLLLAGAALAPPARTPQTNRYALRLQQVWVGLAVVAAGLLALRMAPWLSDTYNNVVVQHKTLEQIYRESRQAAHLDGADYLRQHTQPGDRIAIFGDAPWVYLLAGRANATRFPFINIWIKNRNLPQYDLMTGQFLEGLQRHQPAYVVIPQDDFPWLNNSTIADYRQASHIFAYVEAHYRYEAEVGPFLMFHRRQD